MQLEVVAELVASTVAAAALTGLGVLAELNSVGRFAAGETTVALWFGVVGLLALYAGVYMLGYERVVKGALDLAA